MPRRVGAGAYVAAAIVAMCFGADAAVVAVPLGLQAELLAKVAAYDRNFAVRAGDRAQVLVVANPKSTEAAPAAAGLARALSALPTIGGLAHDESTIPYTSAEALAETCRTRRAAVVYLAPGFDDADIAAISGALGALNVLSVTVDADVVSKGIVLGFDLVSGKSKLVVNLPQARRQNVDFRADVLKIMKVIE